MGQANSRRRTVSMVAVTGSALLVVGCAAMPSSGPIPSVGGQQTGTAQDSTVQLIAVPPKDNESPSALLTGFLDDLASDEADYTNARKYLAPGTSWEPGAQLTVLDQRGSPSQTSDNGKQVTVSVTGRRMATLDAHGSYAPGDQQTVSENFVFQKNAQGQWRITSLPQGILLTEQDFPGIYESVNLYYPADGGTTSGGRSPLVADPVYIRSHIDPMTYAARQLLAGPSKWLSPVVANAFPPGSSIDLDTSGSQIKAYLTLGQGAQWADVSCQAMAAQLYDTLSEVDVSASGEPSVAVQSVALYQGHNGPEQCSADGGNLYQAMSPLDPSGTVYYLNADRHLVSVPPSASGSGGSADPQPVSGALLSAAASAAGGGIGSFAVSPRSDGAVATVTKNGGAVYVSSLHASTAPTEPVLTSASGGLSSPSWDGTGTLWAVDSDPNNPSLRAVENGHEVPVNVTGLQGTVKQVRVATDGARIALLVEDPNTSDTTVVIGRVHRLGTEASPQLAIDGLRTIAQSISSVSSMAWTDGDSLVVLGLPSTTRTLTPISVEIDGSPSGTDGGILPALNGIGDITAFPGPTPRLVASSSESVFRMLAAASWAPVGDGTSGTDKGSAPRFPG
ncbi:LpqB family beta-propeller domain-containing protein [Streptacidiphilus sp. MAP5-3]|uniref:LpqB family beta-propeller domain-containing protein n=1 Tax=unclassified Streptacidiphilus TaxID=2643834 RepID=UPI0035189FFC